MRVKEIIVSATLSWQYNSFTATETILIEEGDDLEQVRLVAQARVRKACTTQIDLQKEMIKRIPAP